MDKCEQNVCRSAWTPLGGNPARRSAQRTGPEVIQ